MNVFKNALFAVLFEQICLFEELALAEFDLILDLCEIRFSILKRLLQSIQVFAHSDKNICSVMPENEKRGRGG